MTDGPLAYDLTLLAMQCRQLADTSSNQDMQKQLLLMADDYEAALANLLGSEQSLGERPLDG
jgi:hypothetical protein